MKHYNTIHGILPFCGIPSPPPVPPSWNVSEQLQNAFAELVAWLDERERLRTRAVWAPACGAQPNETRYSIEELASATSKPEHLRHIRSVATIQRPNNEEYYHALDDPEQE